MDYCDLIVLDPKYQGKGFGKVMLRYSINGMFRNPHINKITLNTFLINVKAQKLYESLGLKKKDSVAEMITKQEKICF